MLYDTNTEIDAILENTRKEIVAVLEKNIAKVLRRCPRLVSFHGRLHDPCSFGSRSSWFVDQDGKRHYWEKSLPPTAAEFMVSYNRLYRFFFLGEFDFPEGSDQGEWR